MTDSPAQLAADERLVRETLAYQYQDVPGLLSICSDGDRWAGRRFTTDEDGITAATAYVMQLDQRRAKGIYTQVTTLREAPEKGRGGKELAHAVSWLWADGDFGSLGHKPGPDDLPHPVDAEHVREIVLASGLPEPTGWVLSGGGCNPVWMLDQPRLITDDADRAAVEELTTDVQRILGACAYGHGCTWDMGIGNLDRLMRLPGTINRKDGQERPATSIAGTGLPVSWDAMSEAVARLAPEAHAVIEKADAEKHTRAAERTGRGSVPPPRAARPLPSSGASVFDILAAGLTFRDVLEPAGWTYRGSSGGREKWLRPASADGAAESEYSLICDDHVAVNWSERSGLPVGQQPPGRKLTVPTVWAHLHYGGNESEAARDVLRAAFDLDARPAARALPPAVLAQVKQHCRPPRTEQPPPPAPPAEDMWGPELLDEPEPEHGRPDDAPQAPAVQPGLLPETFWNARPVFQHIRQAAHAEGSSGDVLFFSLLARLSAMVSHRIGAVSGIGGRASLNMFVAVVAASGGGKSIGTKVARAILPPLDPEFRDGLPIGSGEGIAEAFMGTVDEETGEIHAKGPLRGDPVTRKVRKQVRHNAYFYVDEGQTLASLAERAGSVLGETLRRAAIGETLGQTNASEERTRYVAAGSYSLGMVVGFQPSTAMPVIADASTGTPQRFLWAWAADPSIPDEPPPSPGPLPVNPASIQPADSLDIVLPERIRRMLWSEHVARNRGELQIDELDGHANLMKVKLTALIALLDGGRIEATEEDWELAETVWRTSCAVRATLIQRAAREAEAARRREEDAKVAQELRAHQAKNDTDRSLERIARLVRKHSSAVGGITFGELNRKLRSSDRPLLHRSVDVAEAHGWVLIEGERVCVQTG